MAYGLNAPTRERFAVLFRLHLILAWRPAKGRGLSEGLGTTVLIGLMVLLGGLCGLAGFMAAAKISKEAEAAPLVLWGGGAAIFCFFLFIGLFAEGVGGGIDLSRLFHMPVSPREMILASLAARMLGPWSLPPLGFFAGCGAGWLVAGRASLALWVPAAAALWFLHVYLVLTAADFLLYHLRRSRRLMETLSLVGIVLYLGFLVAQNLMITPHETGGPGPPAWIGGILDIWHGYGQLLLLLPGVSAVSWVGGSWWALARLPAALAETGGLLLLGGWLLRRLMERGASEARRKRARERSRREIRRTGLLDRLPIWPYFVKDARYYLRDPYLKTALLGVLVMPFILTIIFRSEAFGDAYLHYGMAVFLLTTFSQLSTNHLAIERSGLQLLLGSPSPRWQMLMGKNAVLLAVYMTVMVVPVGLLAWKGAALVLLAADYLMALSLGLIYFGAGNYLAILMPVPVAPRGRRLVAQVPAGKMFLLGLLQMALVAAASAVGLPVILGRLAFGHFVKAPAIAVLLAGVMVAYGAILYVVLLAGAARLMPAREAAILEALVRDQQ